MFGIAQIKRMNPDRPYKATEAKKLAASKKAARESIGTLMEHCYDLIHRAAHTGGNSIEPPLIGIQTPITESQRQRVKEQLVKDGYTIQPDGRVTW